MFDVNLDEVEVTLSFIRWLDGKGLVKDAKLKGVRGVIGKCRLSQIELMLIGYQTADPYGGTSRNPSFPQICGTTPTLATLSSSLSMSKMPL